MVDDSGNFSTKKRTKKKSKEEVPQENFTMYSKNILRNRKERDYSGNYCKLIFKKYKDLKTKLNKEELAEFTEELYIENPINTEKIFNSIDIFDVIGCIKYSRPHHPKSYLVINKNKEEQILEVIPWQHTWLDNPSEKIRISVKEFQHQHKNLNLDNKITFEDLGLSLSLEIYVKLYKFNKKDDNFSIPENDVRKVRIVTMIKQETPQNIE